MVILQENVEGWDGQEEIPDIGKGKEEWSHVTQVGKGWYTLSNGDK